MSKYIRRRPPRELEMDPDFYAFDSPSDYLSYDKSNFSFPEGFNAQQKIDKLSIDEQRQYIADVYGRNWASNLPSVSLSAEELDKEYDKALSERDPYLEMFENYESDAALNQFSNFAEFMQYMNDVYGKDWTSNHPSNRLSFDQLDEAYDKALSELEEQHTLWAIDEQPLVREYLYCPSVEECEHSTRSLEWPQNAHDAMKTRRSKRLASTIRARTKLIKQFMPGGLVQHKYQKARKALDMYDKLHMSWKSLRKFFGQVIPGPAQLEMYSDTVHRFKSRVKLASRYEGYFLVAGRFVMYDPTPKEAKLTVAHDDASVVSDAENKHSKFYVPEVLLSADPVWNGIMKRFQKYLLQHNPKYHGNVSYLPKKRLDYLGKRQSKICKGTKVVTSDIRSHNQLPKIYHMSVLLRHFINI